MIKSVSEGIGIARVLESFDNEDKCVEVLADAKAALGILQREGVGKVRHIDVGILWLQKAVAQCDKFRENIGDRQYGQSDDKTIWEGQ